MKDEILFKMRLYLAELGDPVYSWSTEGVRARSYAKTTVQYLINKVVDSDDPPSMVISEFIKVADKRCGLVYRVAYETAVDLYDHVIL